MLLMRNCLLRLQEIDSEKWSLHRVLQVYSDKVVTIEINNPRAQPVWQKTVELEIDIETKRVVILKEDSCETVLPHIRDLSNAQRKNLEVSWEAVYLVTSQGDLAFIPHERSKLIAEAVKKTGRSEKAIRKDLRRFFQGGQIKLAIVARFDLWGGKGQERTDLKEDAKWAKDRARVQGKESKPGSNVYKRGCRNILSIATGQTLGVNVSNEFREAIVRGGKKAFKTLGMSYKRAYESTLKEEACFHRGYRLKNGNIIPNLKPAEEIISLDQFKYWYKKDRHRNFIKELMMRVGKRAYYLHYRPIGGDSSERALGPGSIFQIDSTIADIYLRHSLNRKWLIGRPTLYLVIDLFSRMIVGFAVTLEPPSWLGVMLALDNTAANKVDFCKELEIEINHEEWPCEYLPEEIVADHQEFDGYNADNLADAFGIDICLTPPFRPDLKAVIERSFRWFNDEEIHWLLGASKKTARERGEKDRRLDGVLTINEFRKLMTLCILDHNNERLL